MKSSLLSHLRLPSQETPSIPSQPALDPRYIASGWIQQKTPFFNNSSIVIVVCLPSRCIETAGLLLCACSLPQEPVSESFPSNERLLWLRYSGFQASYHNIIITLCKWIWRLDSFDSRNVTMVGFRESLSFIN
jgi:hypothetical protein